jgi:DNA-binding response OmpR family regulator
VDSKIRRLEESVNISETRVLQCGNLTIDQGSSEIRVDGKVVKLTLIESGLLKFFIENQGQLKKREEIVKAVWESDDIKDRILDPHILALRKKLSSFDHKICTVHRVGYVLKQSEEKVNV